MSNISTIVAVMACLFASTGEVDASVPWWTLLAASISWLVLWAQVVVIPFYNKGEDLHRNYFTAGELNTAQTAIESNRVIPALCRMFDRASDQRSDRRTRIDIQELLQGIDYVSDLDEALDAMSAITSLKAQYELLHAKASRLWKWGAGHLVSTAVLVFAMSMKRIEDALSGVVTITVSQMDFWSWLCIALGMLWLLTLAVMVFQWFRFHGQINGFRRSMEQAQSPVVTGQKGGSP